MANLAQLRILEGLDGFLLVDKPAGFSFSTVVKSVKRKFNLIKVGHGGSLDAMASGLLILLLNDANKFVGEVMGADRAYTGVMRLGGTTDTGDRYGRPLELSTPPMPPADARGDIFQTEPRFCSVRKEGSAGYEIADTGEHSQFLAHIYRFELGDSGEFSLSASKGLLPRALAQDLGATLMSLRRTRIGRFSVEEAIPFDRLLETDPADFAAMVMPLSSALK